MIDLQMNERAWAIADDAAGRASELRLAVHTLASGARVIDAGIDVPGGLAAGAMLAELCMGGLGHVSYVPIVIGGHSEAAARRAGRLGDGFFPSIGAQVDTLPLLDVVRRSAEQAGRDPKKVELILGCPGALPNSGSDPRAAVEARIAQGAGRLALPVNAFLPDLETTLARFGEDIIKPYADA